MSLFKRDCVTCPSPDPCNCQANEVCVVTVQTCEECSKTICSASGTDNGGGSSSPASSSAGSSHTGAIAGGIVGGIAAFGIVLAFLLWKFVYSESARQKRQEQLMMMDQDYIDSNVTPNVDAEAGFFEKQRMSRESISGIGMLDGKSSTRLSSVTMSSVNTGRGSNIIPIAYIPGVTSRQQQQLLQHPTEQFFSASDILRESQISTDDNIRSSIATTNYRGSAYEPDIFTAVPMKPNLVEVVGSASTLKSRPNPGLSLNTQEALDSAGNRDSTNSTVLISAQQAMRLSGARSIRIGKSQPIGLQSEFIREEEESDGGVAGSGVAGSGMAGGIAGGIPSTTAIITPSGRTTPPPRPSTSTINTTTSSPPRLSKFSRTASQISAVLHRSSSNKFTATNSIKETPTSPTVPSSSPSLDLRFSSSSAFEVQLPHMNDDESSISTKSMGSNKQRRSIPPPVPPLPRSSRPSSSISSVSKTPSRSSRMSRKTNGNRESLEYIADDLPQEAYLYATSPYLQDGGEYFEDPTNPDNPPHSHSRSSSSSSIATSLSEKAADITTLIKPPNEQSSPFDDKFES